MSTQIGRIKYGTVIRVRPTRSGSFSDGRRWMVIRRDPERQTVHTLFLDPPAEVEWTEVIILSSFEVVEP